MLQQTGDIQHSPGSMPSSHREVLQSNGKGSSLQSWQAGPPKNWGQLRRTLRETQSQLGGSLQSHRSTSKGIIHHRSNGWKADTPHMERAKPPEVQQLRKEMDKGRIHSPSSQETFCSFYLSRFSPNEELFFLPSPQRHFANDFWRWNYSHNFNTKISLMVFFP